MAKNEIVTTENETTAVVAETLHVDVEQSDMMIPFLKVVQSLSEEVTQGKDKFNPDVRPGDIYDSITRTILKDAKAVICGMRKYYAEWTPEVRGSLVAKHKADSDVVRNAVKIDRVTDKGSKYFTLATKEGNDLVETYGIVMIVKNGDGVVMPAVLTLAKTSFMVGKQLTTILAIQQSKGVPVFKLGTTVTSNTKGSWFKPAFSFDSIETDPDIINMAKGISGLTDSILFSNADIDPQETV